MAVLLPKANSLSVEELGTTSGTALITSAAGSATSNLSAFCQRIRTGIDEVTSTHDHSNEETKRRFGDFNFCVLVARSLSLNALTDGKVLVQKRVLRREKTNDSELRALGYFISNPTCIVIPKHPASNMPYTTLSILLNRRCYHPFSGLYLVSNDGNLSISPTQTSSGSLPLRGSKKRPSRTMLLLGIIPLE